VIACRDKLQFLAAGKESLDLLRKQVGECLYTIQSFYSNTNWVEMYGGIPYLDFGEFGVFSPIYMYALFVRDSILYLICLKMSQATQS